MCEKAVASSFEFELNFFGFHSQQNKTIGFQPDRLVPAGRGNQRPSGQGVSGPNGTTMRMSFVRFGGTRCLSSHVTASFAYCDGVVCSTLGTVIHRILVPCAHFEQVSSHLVYVVGTRKEVGLAEKEMQDV